jgi:hypothetical protein
MEDWAPSLLWIVRVLGHALWPCKLPCILPTFYERSFLDVCVVVHLDDILIYSENPDEHLKHVEVLRRLRANNLYAKVKKCAFSVDTTDFLGFVIGPDGLRMGDSRIEVICDWPTPRKVKDVQSFLGFANCYRRFIALYFDTTVLLTRRTRKNVPVASSPQCEDAFQLLKTAFASAPILLHFDPTLPPVVETGASGPAKLAAQQLAASLLREVAMDAAALVHSSVLTLDISVLVEDIKAGYFVDPLYARNSTFVSMAPPHAFPLIPSEPRLMDPRVYVVE